MALTAKDLRITLTLDPDTAKLQKAMQLLGGDIATQLKQEKSLTEELERQRSVVQKIQVASQGKFVRQRVVAERQQEKAEQDYDANLTAERFRQQTGAQKASAVVGALGAEGGMAGKGQALAASGALGAEGAAAAGPIGAALALGAVVKKVAETVAAAPFKKINEGLTVVSGSLRELQGPLGPIGIGFNVLKGSVEGLMRSVPVVGGALAKAAGPIVDNFRGITESLVSMAAVSSPGQFKQWTMALEDVQGVFGITFTPILNTMTDSVRLFGEVVATVLPNMEEMEEVVAAFRPGFDTLRQAVQGFLDEFGPTMREGIIVTFTVVAEVAGLAAAALGNFTRTVGDFMRAIGLSAAEADQGHRSDVGAAARPAHISGLEDYQRRLQESAFSQGVGGGERPELRSANYLEGILGAMKEVEKWLVAIKDYLINASPVGLGVNVASRVSQEAQNFGLRPLDVVDPLRFRGGSRDAW